MNVKLIYATSRNGVIGRGSEIPWYIPDDLKRFKKLTFGHIVVMGRKTWESLPRKPLAGRINIVITSQSNYDAPGAIVVGSVQEAFREATKKRSDLRMNCFVIGGESVYQEALPYADEHFITLIHHDVEGDVFAPKMSMASVCQLLPNVVPINDAYLIEESKTEFVKFADSEEPIRVRYDYLTIRTTPTHKTQDLFD